MKTTGNSSADEQGQEAKNQHFSEQQIFQELFDRNSLFSKYDYTNIPDREDINEHYIHDREDPVHNQTDEKVRIRSSGYSENFDKQNPA